MMKAESKTFSVYPDTLEQIAEIIEFKNDPSYKQANVIRDSVKAMWLKQKADLDDKRYEEGALNE